MQSDDEDVPPLTDYTEKLKQKFGASTFESVNDPQPSEASSERNGDNSKVGTTNKQTSSVSLKSSSSSKSKCSEFGGFQKGFLFGGPTSKDNQSSINGPKESIPYLKAKKESPAQSSLVMSDVQRSMETSNPLMDTKDWLTDDLLGRIQENPALLSALSNPKFSQVLKEFQEDPTAAQKKYANDESVRQFMETFSSLLGTHFSQLGDRQVQSGGADNSGAMTQVDTEVESALSRPGVKEALLDPDVKRLLALLKSDPGKAQVELRRADSVLQGKLKTLIEAGVLSMHQ